MRVTVWVWVCVHVLLAAHAAQNTVPEDVPGWLACAHRRVGWAEGQQNWIIGEALLVARLAEAGTHALFKRCPRVGGEL